MIYKVTLDSDYMDMNLPTEGKYFKSLENAKKYLDGKLQYILDNYEVSKECFEEYSIENDKYDYRVNKSLNYESNTITEPRYISLEDKILIEIETIVKLGKYSSKYNSHFDNRILLYLKELTLEDE